MLTAGGTSCKLWDIVGGGRLVHDFTSHQKLVTSLSLDGTSTRLLSAGLDGFVKVYELGAFNVTHQLRFAAPVLCMAMAPDNSRLVVGCTDGSLHIRQRAFTMGESLLERKEAAVLRSGSFRYFLRGRGAEAAAGVDEVPVRDTKPSLRPHDKLLKAFRFGEALRAALKTRSAAVAASVLQELVERQALQQAVASLWRDEDAGSKGGDEGESGLSSLVNFVCRYVSHPRYSALLIDVANVLVDLSTPRLRVSGAEGLDALFAKLQHKLRDEIAVGRELLGAQGVLDLLMAANTSDQ